MSGHHTIRADPDYVSMDAQRSPTALLRELERLRQENARLSKLLELRGDTVPADEQPAIPVRRPGLVTHDSPTGDKLALYADLFQARRGVYALRWENHRTERSGWSPAVAGGWGRVADKRHAPHLPLTADVLTRPPQRRRLHRALSPLVGQRMPLAGCGLRRAGRDAGRARVHEGARSRGIPAALKLSRSGRGAHVWIFFSASS